MNVIVNMCASIGLESSCCLIPLPVLDGGIGTVCCHNNKDPAMREQGADAVVVRGNRGERERTSEASEVDGNSEKQLNKDSNKNVPTQLGDEGT